MKFIEQTIIVNVDTLKKKYHKKLDLPVKVDEFSVKSTNKKGILEIVFKKKDQGK